MLKLQVPRVAIQLALLSMICQSSSPHRDQLIQHVEFFSGLQAITYAFLEAGSPSRRAMELQALYITKFQMHLWGGGDSKHTSCGFKIREEAQVKWEL